MGSLRFKIIVYVLFWVWVIRCYVLLIKLLLVWGCFGSYCVYNWINKGILMIFMQFVFIGLFFVLVLVFCKYFIVFVKVYCYCYLRMVLVLVLLLFKFLKMFWYQYSFLFIERSLRKFLMKRFFFKRYFWLFYFFLVFCSFV